MFTQTYGKIMEGAQNMTISHFLTMLMVSDKTIHKAFRIHKTL